MSFASSIGGMISDVFESLASLGIHIDQAIVEEVIDALRDAADDLGDNSFQNRARISTTSFGATDHSHDLGFHHDLAHTVIGDTIVGVVADLENFGTNVRKAIELMHNTDDAARGDLQQRLAVVEALAYYSRHSQGDRANDESRNNNVPWGGDD